MITLKKIKIYSSYNGNIDAYARKTINKEPEINDREWTLIDNFIQDLYLVKKGKASVSYEKRLFDNLKANCENEEVIKELIHLAENG